MQNKLPLLVSLFLWGILLVVMLTCATLLMACGSQQGSERTNSTESEPSPLTPNGSCQIEATNNSGSISCAASSSCVIIAPDNSGSISCGSGSETATLTLSATGPSTFMVEFSLPVIRAECSTICTDQQTLVESPVINSFATSGMLSDICINNAVPHRVTCVGLDQTGEGVITDSITLDS